MRIMGLGLLSTLKVPYVVGKGPCTSKLYSHSYEHTSTDFTAL